MAERSEDARLSAPGRNGVGRNRPRRRPSEARQIGSDNLSKPAIGEWSRRQHEGQRRAMDATLDEIGRAGTLDSAKTPMI